MDLFFSPEVQPGDFTFNPEESKHIIRVLRRKRGDELSLTDGKGNLLIGQITDDHPNKCLVTIKDSKLMPKQRSYHLHLAVAPTKNMGRFEWFLEKATEIGIDEITPIACKHSERIHINTERLNKVMVAALKQSQQFWLPKLNPLQSIEDLIQLKVTGQKFIAYVDMDNKTSLKSAYIPGQDSIVLIGPEGDFSEQEVKAAISTGYLQISLGENRLRTETAALVACHTINLLNQQ
jgi:16S rRNA (uracil1498-N3)-methyltransferase